MRSLELEFAFWCELSACFIQLLCESFDGLLRSTIDSYSYVIYKLT